jgi:hypothetical protein
VLKFFVPKIIRKFRSFAEADKADRAFYRQISGEERLNILVELTKHEPQQRLERVCRVVKLSELTEANEGDEVERLRTPR